MYTKLQFQKSSALQRVTFSLSSVIRTMDGGRPKFTEETDTLGWSPATISKLVEQCP